jgi:hypothetical protein
MISIVFASLIIHEFDNAQISILKFSNAHKKVNEPYNKSGPIITGLNYECMFA